MFWNEIKKIASAAGFAIGIMTLAINLFNGHTLLHSAYTAIVIMIAASILFLFCLRGIGSILSSFLLQKKMEADKEKEKRAKQLAREKLEELKERRKKYEQRTRDNIRNQASQINTENKAEAQKNQDTQENQDSTIPDEGEKVPA